MSVMDANEDAGLNIFQYKVILGVLGLGPYILSVLVLVPLILSVLGIVI